MTTTIGSLAVSLSMDSSNFTGSINQMNRHLTAMGSELRAAKALGAEYGKSVEGLTSKKEILTRTVATSSVKLTEERRKYDQLVASGTANEATLERQARRVNEAQVQYNRLTTELNEVTEELRIQSSAWTQNGERMQAFGNQLTSVGDKMTGVGKKMSMAITAPIVAAGTASVKMAADFEAQMDRVGAIAGATSSDMDKMTASALELGASTSKSASEVAMGMEEMAAMGFAVNDILGAMPGVISAAEASGSDMAQTAEVMASTLNIFGLEASQAGKVADVLATTANISAASLTDMQYALKYAGPPAAALGVSLEELSAGIGIMTNAGMKGEQAGTTLRGALLGLLDPSEENSKRMEKMGIAITDNNGNFVGLSKLVRGLSVALKDQTDTQKAATISALVGKEAVSGMLSLMKAGPDTIDKMTKSLENSAGSSAIAAAKMKDNFKGALEELGGTIETAAITIGNKLIPTLRKGSETIQGLVEKFSALSPEAQKNIMVMAGVAAAIGPVLVIGGTLVSSIGSIIGAAGAMSVAIGAAGGATTAFGATLALVTGPIGWTVGGIALLTAGVGAATLAYKESNDINLEVLENKQKEIAKNDELIANYDALQNQNQLTNDEMLRYLDIQSELASTNAPAKVAELKDEQANLLKESTLTNDQMDEFLALNQQVIENAPFTVKAISEHGKAYATNTGALKELNAEKAKELEAGAYSTVIKSLDEQNKLIKQQKEYVGEINKLNESIQATKVLMDSTTGEIAAQEAKILDIENEKIGASGTELIQLDSKLQYEKSILADKKNQLLEAESMSVTYSDHLVQQQEIIGKNEKELAQLEDAQFKYEEIILAQAGINSEKGNGLIKINEELGKLDTQKAKLSENLKLGKIGTAEYQEQNNKIDTQIAKLKDAKSELELINKRAGQTIYRDVLPSEKTEKAWSLLEQKLRGNVSKTIDLSYSYPKLGGPLGATLNADTNADGTRYAPGGLSWVGEEGPELMYLPTGARIVPNGDSQTLLNKWNIPTGTRMADNMVSMASKTANFLSSYNSSSSTSQNHQVNSAKRGQGNLDLLIKAIEKLASRPIQTSLEMNGQSVGEAVFETINNMQYNQTSISAIMKGVNL